MAGISKVRVTDGFSNELDLEKKVNAIIAEETHLVVDVKYVIEHDNEEENIYHRAMILFKQF